MRKFWVGQKVICIGEFIVKRKYREEYPVVGMIYTIRGFIEYKGQVGILLEEIVNPKYQYGEGHNEAAYGIHNFRPAEYQSATAEILERFKVKEEKIDADIKRATKEKIKQINK